MPVIQVQHPLVRYKVGLLRQNDISTKDFRALTNKLGRVLAYEATADFPLHATTIDGRSGPTAIEQIAGKNVTIVPVLRAGLGLLDGVLDMIANAKVSVVGFSRNHETLQPEHHFERPVGQLNERPALIVEPMPATGASMITTVNLLKARGCTDIRALVLVPRHGDFETRKRAFDPMAALQILAMPAGIAAVCALPSGRMHRFRHVPKSPWRGTGGRA